MIGRPEWFKRRKYGGWGLYPITWQGWVYIAAMIAPLIVFHSLPWWTDTTRIWVTVAWAAILLFDTTDIMIRLRKDERERIHEAYAERNAAWVMVLVLVAAILYQIISTGLQGPPEIDWWIVAALFGGLGAKAISNLYLERKA